MRSVTPVGPRWVRKISEDSVDGGPRALVVVGPEVAVGVEGLARAGVAQTGLDDLDRLAVTDEERGVAPREPPADGDEVARPAGGSGRQTTGLLWRQPHFGAHALSPARGVSWIAPWTATSGPGPTQASTPPTCPRSTTPLSTRMQRRM